MISIAPTALPAMSVPDNRIGVISAGFVDRLKPGAFIAFGKFDGVFSDGAYHAIDQAKKVIFQDNWLDRVFAPEAVLTSVKEICNG